MALIADSCRRVMIDSLRRGEPNAQLVHSGDLSGDLISEIEILADALGVEPEADRLERSAAAARLDAMRRTNEERGEERKVIDHG